MRKTFLALFAAALVALGGAAAMLYVYERPTALDVAVPQLAEDMRLMTAAAHLFAKEHKSIALRLMPVADLASAAALLEFGKADLAVMRGDIAASTSAQSLVILHRNAALLMVPGDSKLRRVTDLRGKRIGVVHEVASIDANAHLLQDILSQYDVRARAVTLVSLAPHEVRDALEANRVDAIFAALPPQTGSANDVVGALAGLSRKAPFFIPIDEAKAISKRFPAMEPMEIVQGAFGGDPPRPGAAVDSLSVSVLLMAKNSLRDDVASTVTRLFFSNCGSIALAAPLANSIEAPSTDRGGAIPVHQGAVDYLDGTERGFFERYSDAFYIGAMLLSLVGSGAAAMVGRLNDSAHRQVEQMTEKLLELLKSAQAATSFAELDAYAREADETVTGMLSDRKLRGIAGQSLHLVTLALDQTRRAIEERRGALASERRVVEFPGRGLPPSG